MSDQRKEDLELVKRHLAQLSEHFDAVQIFATRYNANKLEGFDEDGLTTRINVGTGNYFARYGHVAYWLKQESPLPEGSDFPPKDEDQS